MIPGSWQHHMKLQLFFKASTNLLKNSRALRYIKLALQCHYAYCSVRSIMYLLVLLFRIQCLSLCGDIQLLLAQNASNRAAYLEEYNYQTNEDQELLHRESSCQVNKSVSITEQEMWKKSFSCFEKGMKDFEAIEYSTNTSHQSACVAQQQRICAQAHCAVSADLSRGEFSQEEALYYNKIEQEVTEAMLKSLKYCDMQTESARQPLYQYRAATIHHRLASMYHSCFRNQVGDEHLRKQHRSLAELHCSKAVRLSLSWKDASCSAPCWLRVAFAEFTMAGESEQLGQAEDPDRSTQRRMAQS